MKKEAEIHMSLRHANIVLMIGTVFEEMHYGLVLEYVQHGSLDRFIQTINKQSGKVFRNVTKAGL